MLNEDILDFFGDSIALGEAEAAQRVEIERREHVYRGGRPPLTAKDRTVILADDGAATGATMCAAVRAVRKLEARKIVVALPVASRSAYEMLRREADEVICISTPPTFYAVGQWYHDFTQTTDEEVTDLLARADALISRTADLENRPS